MAITRRTVLPLIALALVTLAIVVHDVLRPPAAPQAVAAAEDSRQAPEAPTVSRGLSRAALVYPGEFAHELVVRLRPALVMAEPLDGSASPEPALVLSARTALVAAGPPAAHWRVHAGDRAIPAQLAGIDSVHGIALLRLAEDAPVSGPAVQQGMPAAPEPLVALRPRAQHPAVQYFAASSLPLRARIPAASIEPGDVVVNLEGRLVGFAGRTSRGPVLLDGHVAGHIAEALEKIGRHPHPWLGADIQTITPALRPRFAAGTLVVTFVWPGSTAATAGLRAGQPFAAAHAGGRITTAEALMQALNPGETVRFEPERGGKEILVAVTDLQSPPDDLADPRGLWPRIEEGVPIAVAPGSDALAAGLTPDDRIDAIDLRPATLAALQQSLKRGSAVLLTVERDNRRRFVLLPARGATGPPPSARAGTTR